jgi:hypothetical protein
LNSTLNEIERVDQLAPAADKRGVGVVSYYGQFKARVAETKTAYRRHAELELGRGNPAVQACQ